MTQRVKRSLFSILMVMVFSVIARGEGETSENSGPLVLTPENTVIVDKTVYAGRQLQYHLLKCVAKVKDADDYAIDGKVTDRSKSPGFALYRDSRQVPEGKNILAVGKTSYLTDSEKKELEEKNGSVLIRRKGNVVVIAGSGDPWGGPMAAVNLFLNRCAGVRMYAPSEEDLWLSMPESNEIVIGDLDLLKKPFFAKADFSGGAAERNRKWERMNTIITEGIPLRANHAIIRYFNPDKYHVQYPQLFPMTKEGTRPKPMGDAWNPCLADPDLAAKVAMDEVRLMMNPKDAKGNPRPAPQYLSFGVMDCHYDCQCPVCQKSLKENKGNAANLWYAFLNKVAQQCQQEFPKLYLTSYNYSNIEIPSGMQIEPNIAIDNVIKSYQYTTPGYWDAETKGILAFADLGAKWVTHDWNFQAVTPRIYSRQMASLLQWGAQNGMMGIYTEWSPLEYWYLNGANYWVLRQLLSDPYQDPDALWRQYCKDMYGKAWQEMYQFYDMFQQRYVLSPGRYRLMDWPREESVGFTEEDLKKQRELLESSIAMTRDDPKIQKRLDAVMRYFRAHELLAQATGVPGRLFHQYTILDKQNGINKEALAFYVNDDASKLFEFDEYYDTKRTVAPDSNAEDQASGLRFSYRNNYSRALGTILSAVRDQALTGIDLEKADAATIGKILEKSREIFKANLPEKNNPKRVEELMALLNKILWVPKSDVMPKIDGDLTDPVWQKAATLDGFTIADVLVPSREGNETEGKVMRVGDKLVFAVTCQQPKGIWSETTPDRHTGTRIWREASCEFFLGPICEENKKQELIQYIINSLGAYRGFQKAQDNRQDMECAVKVAEDGKSYTIETVIPLKVDGKYDFSQEKLLTFNIMRNPFYSNTFNPTERIGWAPIFFTASNPGSRGWLVFEQ